MSELFQRCSPEETLSSIEQRLNQGATPVAVIEEMLPKSRDEALSWVRRLSGWEEFRGQYLNQAIALARVISRRAMRQYRLMLREDGRVVERRAEGKGWKPPMPVASFPLKVGGEEVRVEYTTQYFPNDDTALVYIVSPHEPAQAHALSETGYYSHFVPHDVVEVCGGPQAYTALLADAVLRGQEQELIEAFDGPLPDTDARRPRRTNRSAAEPGGHAERLIVDQEKSQALPRQGMLF